jgi:GntR family transcriptional repressor for pyruvate dehydrogenase complex
MRELVRQSLSDSLTERIMELIRDQGLRPGSRLPSTRALAEQFSVATATVRESLRRLQTSGAIEVRHGSGVYVSASVDRLVLPNPNVPEPHGEQLLQLLDARALMEPYLAGLAAARRDPQRLADLRELLATAQRHLLGAPGDDAALHEANMAFHRSVAAASGHGVLREVVDSLLFVHAGEQREILQIFDDRVRDYDEHRAVLEAIEAGDAELASDLMRRHLDDVKNVVSRRAEKAESTGPASGAPAQRGADRSRKHRPSL